MELLLVITQWPSRLGLLHKCPFHDFFIYIFQNQGVNTLLLEHRKEYVNKIYFILVMTRQ